MGAHDFKLNMELRFVLEKQGISMFRGLLHRNQLLCQQSVLLRCQLVNSQCLCQVSLGLKEVQMEAHDFKIKKVPHFRSKTCEYKCFEVCYS